MKKLPVLAFLIALPAAAQFSERIDVSAIEIPVYVRDASGKLPRDLKPEDFTLLEDGVAQTIIGVDYPIDPIAPSATAAPPPAGGLKAAAPRRALIVVYIQQSLSTVPGLRHALEVAAGQAASLTAVGDVEIVIDYPSPHVVLRASGDAEQVRRTLFELSRTAAGQQRVIRERLEYLGTLGIRQSDKIDRRGLAAAQLEAMTIRQQQEAFLSWLSRYPADPSAARTRAVVMITDGFDADPSEFYGGASDPADAATLRSLSATPRQEEIGRALAATGWTALSFAPGWMQSASAPKFDVGYSGRGELNAFKRDAAESTNIPTAINLHPLDPLQTLADQTGGSVQTNAAKLSAELEGLANRIVLTYQIRRRRDGQVHRVEVKPRRAGLVVRAQRWVASGTPEAIAAARATTIATSEAERGELPVQCVVRTVGSGNELQSDLEATVNLAPIDSVRQQLTAGTLRFAIAVAAPDAAPFTLTKRMENLDLASQSRWKMTFQVKHRPGAAISIVADEPATGAWGGAVCGTAAAAAAAAPAEPSESFRQAIAAAKTSGRMIVLYLRGSSAADKKTDEWLANARSHQSLAAILDDFVVATDFTGRMIDALAGFRNTREPQLLLLDPSGAPLDNIGFIEYPQLAALLAQYRRQAPVFAASARAAEAGRHAEALLLRGNGLLYAGVTGEPVEKLYRKVLELAAPAGDARIVQDAEIGLATLASKARDHNEAINIFKRVAANPATPELGARAWILLGHERKEQGDRRAAIAAYQSGWRVAPKPSPYADAARRYLEAMGSAPESDVEAAIAAGNVRLLFPHRAVLAGDIEVAAAAPRQAARVEFYLDDVRVAERDRAPFAAKIALGAVPRVHTLKVVAFDAKETPIGEDSAVINDRAEALGVEIVAPRESTVEASTVIEVQPRVPEGMRLDAVELYWNEQKLATLTAPPYRTTLTLPRRRELGYIRAVVRDATGTTAEDAKLINAQGAGEVMRVDAVELYATVQDRAGHNVEGLTAADFTVKEDGVKVPVEVRSGANDPITVGLAVDASESMRNAMASVMEYATEFLHHSLSRGDQTFVVSFAESPELYQPLTADLEQVKASIFDMRAHGATALWDSIVFSLDQFRSVRGKRALLLFTDGEDTGSRAAPKAVLQYAHEIGVPVYVVLVYTGPRSGSEANNLFRDTQISARFERDENLQRLAEETGGAFIRYPRQKDLPKLFQQVRDDTRGAYVLSFVSKSGKKRSELRKVSVAVPGKRGVVVRAPSAYFPR
jgi:VWFA-related protein